LIEKDMNQGDNYEGPRWFSCGD